MPTITLECWATAGEVAMPSVSGTVLLPAWGFSDNAAAPRVPGPVFEAVEGDMLQVTLHNALTEPVSMIFPGMGIAPQPVRADSGRLISFTAHAEPGGSVTYSVEAPHPGTYRYESGTYPERQVQMGLAGALVVRPAGYSPTDPGTWTAYGPSTRSEYDVEQVLILGEVDSRLHTTVGAGVPFDILNFKPDWWTVNGRAFPRTLDPDDATTQPMGARIGVTAAQRVLLRCVNAGFLPHSLHFGGLVARVVAEDAVPLATPRLDATYEKQTLLIPPGGTADVILSPSAPGEFILFDRDLKNVVNEERFPGGMMTLLSVGP
jgi:FtsP/CotA-like multicopper oxidase with cupredoxin domain